MFLPLSVDLFTEGGSVVLGSSQTSPQSKHHFPAKREATAADDTHPTGILSCYRPQLSCGQGYVFTRVCDSLLTGGFASVHAGLPPPPRGKQIPPLGSSPPPRRHPPGKQPSPPPQKEAPLPEGATPRHAVNERTVRIQLECIRVVFVFA